MNSVGIPHSVARDPENQFRFLSKVTTDWSLRTLAEDQEKYYTAADKKAGKQVPRMGHSWSVRLRDEDPITE